jgi:tetratricopeptide (TPR) repeat protein
MGIRASGMNIAGIMLLIKTFPSIAIKNPQRIVEICDLALQGDTRAPILFAIGHEAAIELQEYEKSLEYSNRIILLLPEKAIGYHLRSISSSNLKNLDQSKIDSDKAISIDPNYRGRFQ